MVILNLDKKQDELVSIAECNIGKEDSSKMDMTGSISQI